MQVPIYQEVARRSIWWEVSPDKCWGYRVFVGTETTTEQLWDPSLRADRVRSPLSLHWFDICHHSLLIPLVFAVQSWRTEQEGRVHGTLIHSNVSSNEGTVPLTLQLFPLFMLIDIMLVDNCQCRVHTSWDVRKVTSAILAGIRGKGNVDGQCGDDFLFRSFWNCWTSFARTVSKCTNRLLLLIYVC